MSMKDLTVAWRQRLPAVHKLILIYIADASGEHGVRTNKLSIDVLCLFAGATGDDIRTAISYLLANDNLRQWSPGTIAGDEREYYQVVQPPR